MSREPQPAYALRTIYLNLTDRCNLKCRHCWLSPDTVAPGHAWQDSAHPPALSVDRMEAVISHCLPLGLQAVKLTGGEPFLRPEILSFIALFHEKGLAIDIETNGTLIDDTMAAQLAGYRIQNVHVSLDSTDSRQHDAIRGMQGAFDAAIRGIGHLQRHGLNIQIIMALSRENAMQIEPMADLAAKSGAGSLKINPVMPVGRGKSMHRKSMTLPVEKLLETARWIASDLQKRCPVDICFSIPVAFRPLPEIVHGDHSECAILNIMGIVENGDISFCGIECLERELVMGNITSHRMDEIWRDHPLLAEMRHAVPAKLEGICGRCFLKKICLGSCRAAAYHNEKRLTAPYWFCREAHEKGLFPESRYR